MMCRDSRMVRSTWVCDGIGATRVKLGERGVSVWIIFGAYVNCVRNRLKDELLPSLPGRRIDRIFLTVLISALTHSASLMHKLGCTPLGHRFSVYAVLFEFRFVKATAINTITGTTKLSGMRIEQTLSTQ